MPELAEVEKVRKLVEDNALNKKIINVKAFEDEIVFLKKKPKEIESSLINGKIKKVSRKGKIFWMEIEGKNKMNISFHLGMTGRMIIRGNKDITTYYRYPDKNIIDDWPPRFVKIIFTFDDNSEMAFTNTRRLGRVRLHKNLPINEEPISKLGVDPYNSMCSLNDFNKMILKRKCPLKAALLDQAFTAGVGNWIADEVCYQSGIYPGKYCHTLNQIQINRIYQSLIDIVKFAVDVNANYDLFPSNWLMHYRWNKAKKKKNKKKKKKSNHDDDEDEDEEEKECEEYLNAHSDSFANKIIYEQVGGRTTAIVFELQSKHNGYRQFKNSKDIGKITSYKDKVKRGKNGENKYILLDNDCNDDNKQNKQDTKKSTKRNTKKRNTKKKSRKKSKKRKLNEIDEHKTESKPPKKKQKKSEKIEKEDKEIMAIKQLNIETHVMTRNKVLIPIELLRRSSRLKNKNKT